MKVETAVLSEISVNEAIRRFPATVEVFNRFGIDACCGGATSIATAADRDGAPLEPLLEALSRAVEQPS